MKRTIRILAVVLVSSLAVAAIAVAASSPTVSTGAASSINDTSVTLHGTINPQGSASTYAFQYGLTSAYGLTTKSKTTGHGTKPVAVSTVASGLVPGTTYHYRLVASNKSGAGQGNDHTFKTSGHPPASATTGPATQVGKTTATLTGAINPNGQATTWTFQYGLTTGYGSQVFGGTLKAANTPSIVVWPLNGLQPGVTFHYRIVALHGSTVASTGADQTFFTLPNPTPKPKVKASTSPHQAKHKPYVFTTKGSVSHPSSIPAALACTGNATVKLFLGKKLLSSSLAAIASNCTYTSTATFKHLPGSGKHKPKKDTLKVEVHFRGTGYLAPADAKSQNVTIGS